MSTPVGPDLVAARMGIVSGHLILESGYGSDCDESVRNSLIKISGNEVLSVEINEVVDAVILWWREDDGDLIDDTLLFGFQKKDLIANNLRKMQSLARTALSKRYAQRFRPKS